MRRFVTIAHPEPGIPMEVGPRPLIFGRAPGGDGVELGDTRASRAHFELAVVDEVGVVRLRDLDSKNGTLVGGQREDTAFLQGGEVIRAGDTLLAFSELEPPPGSAPPLTAGRSPALVWAEVRADRAGRTDLPVLITGPTGAGKELLARRAHDASGRSGPFVPVNCATFNRELLASELFGHVKGAFSGATASRAGLFATATGGTLFLDEIAELPLEQQPALLRALQERRVRPVGADQEIPVDVRFVAATHEELGARCAAGMFREDLWARLRGVLVELPGLAQRREDILPLFRGFLGRPVEISADAAEALLVYGWPHNVRELQHVAGQVRMFADQTGRVEEGMLPSDVQRAVRQGATGRGVRLDEAGLEALLRRHRGNVTSVARAVGRSRQQIYRRLRSFELDPESFR